MGWEWEWVRVGMGRGDHARRALFMRTFPGARHVRLSCMASRPMRPISSKNAASGARNKGPAAALRRPGGVKGLTHDLMRNNRGACREVCPGRRYGQAGEGTVFSRVQPRAQQKVHAHASCFPSQHTTGHSQSSGWPLHSPIPGKVQQHPTHSWLAALPTEEQQAGQSGSAALRCQPTAWLTGCPTLSATLRACLS